MTAYSEKGHSFVSVSLLTYQGTEDEDDIHNHEHLNCCEAVGFWDVACDAVEDVDKDKEDGDKDRHTAGDAFGRNQKTEENGINTFLLATHLIQETMTNMPAGK